MYQQLVLYQQQEVFEFVSTLDTCLERLSGMRMMSKQSNVFYKRSYVQSYVRVGLHLQLFLFFDGCGCCFDDDVELVLVFFRKESRGLVYTNLV